MNTSEFDMINTVINTLIAVVGLVIAYVQLMNERRKRKEEKANKVIISNLVHKINQVMPQKDQIEALSKMPIYSEDDCYRSSIMIADFAKRYLEDYLNKDYAAIEDLYKGILCFESEFSLSYGFGRYIDVFRQTLPSMREIKEKIEQNCSYIEQDLASEDYGGSVVSAGHIHDLCVKEMELRAQLEPYLQELRYKYPERV